MLGHNAIKLALERGYITVTGGPEPLFIGPNSIDMPRTQPLHLRQAARTPC